MKPQVNVRCSAGAEHFLRNICSVVLKRTFAYRTETRMEERRFGLSSGRQHLSPRKDRTNRNAHTVTERPQCSETQSTLFSASTAAMIRGRTNYSSVSQTSSVRTCCLQMFGDCICEPHAQNAGSLFSARATRRRDSPVGFRLCIGNCTHSHARYKYAKR